MTVLLLEARAIGKMHHFANCIPLTPWLACMLPAASYCAMTRLGATSMTLWPLEAKLPIISPKAPVLHRCFKQLGVV